MRKLKIIYFAIIVSLLLLGVFYGLSTLLQRSSQRTSALDNVLISKGDNGDEYIVNLVTKRLTPSFNTYRDVLKSESLPKETSTENTATSVSYIKYSKDKSHAAVFYVTEDTTVEPSDYDGSRPIIDQQEFLCTVATKQCTTSQIFKEANKQYPNIGWDIWDSNKNVLYGNLSMDGMGSKSPVVIYDVTKKTGRTTIGYDCYRKEKCADVVTRTPFSPSLSKFVMIEGSTLLLYNTDSLTAPYKKYDLRVENGDSSDFEISRISTIDWSPDEQVLALGNDTDIYTLDLKDGKITKLWSDVTVGKAGMYWDRGSVMFSPTGRFIIFVDYETYDSGYSADGNSLTTDILKAIDLNHNREIFEVVRDRSIYLQR